ncbi:MAG: hypothetical protein CSB34_07305 [Desulfobulbus propionicus]|nr:MAG: hypothetical protein CSB34_07305 [Desulfobulbus propionicus]
MQLNGKIVTWQNDKGFGFIAPSNGRSDVFFHKNCLIHQFRRPKVGDEVPSELFSKVEQGEVLVVIRHGATAKVSPVLL